MDRRANMTHDDAKMQQLAELIDDRINTALAAGPGFVIGFAIMVVVPLTAFAMAWTVGAGWLWSLVVALWACVALGVAVVRQRAKRLKATKAAIADAVYNNQPVDITKGADDEVEAVDWCLHCEQGTPHSIPCPLDRPVDMAYDDSSYNNQPVGGEQ